jgi:3-methyladenine DNA glycosylase/8-oxoguanine DNA glycosylase
MRKAINHLKKSDPVLSGIIERVGPCRIEYGEPTFASLAEAIIYQQLNGKAALTIFNRFADLAGRPLTPQGILKLSAQQMRSAGLSKQKLSYIRSLADLSHRGELDFRRLPEMSDEEVIAELTKVFLMFTLRRMDVLPTGDFGIQSAIRRHYRKRKMPKPAMMEKIARPWVPYRTIACWYLWKSMDVKTM